MWSFAVAEIMQAKPDKCASREALLGRGFFFRVGSCLLGRDGVSAQLCAVP